MGDPVTVNFNMMDPSMGHQIIQHMQRIEGKVDQLNARISGLTLGVREMALDLSAVEAEVSQNSDAVDSATTLLGTLADEIRATAGDPAKVAELASRLDANTARLAAAVVANTPADPNAGGGGAAPAGGGEAPAGGGPGATPPQFGDQPQ